MLPVPGPEASQEVQLCAPADLPEVQAEAQVPDGDSERLQENVLSLSLGSSGAVII